MNTTSKVIGGIIFLVLLFSAPFLVRYQYIDSGNVGVMVNASGSNRGVDPNPRGVGRVFYCPLFQQVYEFPVYEQNVIWSRDSKEGDQSITISSAQSAQVNCDVGIVFEIRDEKVPILFDKLRRDIDYISHQWLRNHVQEALLRAAESMETMEILGEGKSKLLDTAKKNLNQDFEEYGIDVKMLTFISSPRPEAKVQASIEATITATQVAKQAEAKVASSKAEADQAVETARGEAESIKLKSLAELERAKNQALANEVLAKSITPELIQYQEVQKWDGRLPTVSGHVTPFIDLNKLQHDK